MEFNGSYGQRYNAIAKAKDCVLLPVGERSRKIKWQVPRKANVWYASEDNEDLKEYMKKLLYKIENYDGENCIK